MTGADASEAAGYATALLTAAHAVTHDVDLVVSAGTRDLIMGEALEWCAADPADRPRLLALALASLAVDLLTAWSQDAGRDPVVLLQLVASARATVART